MKQVQDALSTLGIPVMAGFCAGDVARQMPAITGMPSVLSAS